ncbi:MAG: GNAT family N-acetyltransferase [Rhodospirillaceae bacterium]|nr:GNAT family N-acetyltransferase [Rhodospirillaceae bacterium]
MVPIVPLTGPLRAAALALNNRHAVETAPLDEAGLAALIAQAFYAAAVGEEVEAFLIALDETADYASPNFRWFKARYPRFVYIDRVITAPQARGRGHARRLYAALFAKAVAAGHTLAACEVNVDPPNPASDRLHAALGFVEVGRARLQPAGKTVRYLTRAIEPSAAARQERAQGVSWDAGAAPARPVATGDGAER